MKFSVEVILRGSPASEAPLRPEDVETIVDALDDSPGIEEVDAGGSLSERTIELALVVEAEDPDEAWARMSSAVRFALIRTGGSVTGFPRAFREAHVSEFVDV